MDLPSKVDWKEKIGARVEYTARNGTKQEGVVRGATHISEQSGYMVDVKLDGSTRAVFYVPEDMLRLI